MAKDSLTIQQAADAWILTLESRKRHRAKPATLATFRSYIRAQSPQLGIRCCGLRQCPDARLRCAPCVQRARPKNCDEVCGAIKALIAAVIDPQTGEQIYQRVWNADFIDAPEIRNQHKPSVTVSELEAALAASDDFTRALIALAGASGARIGELQSLRIGRRENVSYWNPELATLEIQTSIWNAKEQDPKTPSAVRTIEIAKPVNDLLASFVGERGGFLLKRKRGTRHYVTRSPGQGATA